MHKLTLKDQTFTLKYGTSGIYYASKAIGKPLHEWKDLDAALGLVFAGIYHERRKITLDEVMEMIDFNQLAEITNTCSQAFSEQTQPANEQK